MSECPFDACVLKLALDLRVRGDRVQCRDDVLKSQPQHLSIIGRGKGPFELDGNRLIARKGSVTVRHLNALPA